MRIKELSDRTCVPTRLLRYYEEQGLLCPSRLPNCYRDYDEAEVGRVRQIRGLLDAGLTTEIIKDVLPCLPDTSQLHAADPGPEFVGRIERERDRLDERIAELCRKRTALDGYIGVLAGE